MKQFAILNTLMLFLCCCSTATTQIDNARIYNPTAYIADFVHAVQIDETFHIFGHGTSDNPFNDFDLFHLTINDDLDICDTFIYKSITPNISDYRSQNNIIVNGDTIISTSINPGTVFISSLSDGYLSSIELPFHVERSPYPTSIKSTQDKIIVLTTLYDDSTSKNFNRVFIFTKALQLVSWFDINENEVLSFRDFTIADDELVLIGSQRTGAASSDTFTTKIVVKNISLDGEILSTTYPLEDNLNGLVNDIIYSDGNFIFSYLDYVKSPTNTPGFIQLLARPSIAMIDQNYNVVWDHKVGRDKYSWRNNSRRMTRSHEDDATILVGSQATYSEQDSFPPGDTLTYDGEYAQVEGFITKVMDTGEIAWTRQYAYNDRPWTKTQFNSVVAIDQDRYAITGRVDGLPPDFEPLTSGLFMIVDDEGCAEPGCGESTSNIKLVIPSIDNKLLVYPNPVTDLLTISHDINEDAIYSLYNDAGALVKSEYIKKGQYILIIDMSSLPSGTFTCTRKSKMHAAKSNRVIKI
jgi:hypothetical protein